MLEVLLHERRRLRYFIACANKQNRECTTEEKRTIRKTRTHNNLLQNKEFIPNNIILMNNDNISDCEKKREREKERDKSSTLLLI